MLGFIRHRIGWFLSLAAAIVLCIFLTALLISRQNHYKADLLAREKHAQALTSQIDQQEKNMTDLNSTVEQLKRENADLENKLVAYDILDDYDVLILDRSLPRDLLNAVFAYYKSIDEKDFETYKSLAGDDRMLRYYDEVLKNQNARPNEGDGIKSLVAVASDAKNAAELADASFVGNIVLMVNMGFTNGELIYLRKENGTWHVWDID